MSPRRANAISFTKRLLLFLAFASAAILLFKVADPLGLAQSTEAPGQERKLKVTEYQNMPLEVKVKNLQSKTWHKDLEIEVKNVSGRPIYHILAHLEFPDDTPPISGDVVGFTLHYGKPENIRISHLADPQDIHLDPNEKYSFTIPELERKGFEARHKKYPGVDKNLIFRVSLVSYGDGTGWENGAPRDKRKKSTSVLEPPSAEAEKKRNGIVWIPPALKSQPPRKRPEKTWLMHPPRTRESAVVATVVHHGYQSAGSRHLAIVAKLN